MISQDLFDRSWVFFGPGGSMRLLFLSLLSILISGCGPEQTARESEQQQRDSFVKQKTGELKRFEGYYEGFIQDIQGNSLKARLYIFQVNLFLVNPQTNDIVEIPNIRGLLTAFNNGAWTAFANYETGQFQDDSGDIRMVGETSIMVLKPNDKGDLVGYFIKSGTANSYLSTATFRKKN